LRILVTGGCGFIGSNLIRHMLDRREDIEIINVDKLSYGSNPENLRGIDAARYRFIKGDIADLGLMKGLIPGVDVIINMAAETHVDRSISDPYPFLRSNVEGVMSILESARGANRDVRIIHMSTDEVYGDIPKGSFSERDGLRPSSPYAASKASADLLCLAYHRTYGLDVTIIRSTNNFGPYQFPEKLIPKAIIRALRGMEIPIYGSGSNVRDWIYVLDSCEAIGLIMERGSSGEIYNLSAGNEMTNLEVVRMILEIMGKPEDLIIFVEDRPGHDARYSLDSSKIRGMGWSPAHDFEGALRETVEWYIENEDWWRPLATERILHPTPWRLEW